MPCNLGSLLALSLHLVSFLGRIGRISSNFSVWVMWFFFAMPIFRTPVKQISVEKNAEYMLTLIWKMQNGKAATRGVLYGRTS